MLHSCQKLKKNFRDTFFFIFFLLYVQQAIVSKEYTLIRCRVNSAEVISKKHNIENKVQVYNVQRSGCSAEVSTMKDTARCTEFSGQQDCAPSSQ